MQDKSLSIVTFVKKILAPPFCFYCRDYLDEYEPLCASCTQLIKPILSYKIPLGGHHAMQVHAVSAYEEPLRSLILAKGWSDYTAAQKLGVLIAQRLPDQLLFDYIVPIPLHTSRFAARGFNQVEVMAREVSRLSGRPLFSCLERPKKTAYQSLFSPAGRHKNVESAFLYNVLMPIEGRRILLIDDVMTSGATLSKAARALVQGNPSEICAVVACRVV